MKRLLSILGFVILSAAAFAVETGFDEVGISCNAVTTTGACTTLNVHPPDYVHIPSVASFSWQTIFAGGTPTSISVTLEGSLDNVTFTTLDTSTSTSGSTRSKSGTEVKYFRCNVGAYNRNGTTLTCQIMPTRTTGAGAGVFPQSAALAASQWLNSYDAATGLYGQGQINYSDLAGAPPSGLPAGPTSPNGVPQALLSTPSGGVAGAPLYGLAGVPVNSQTGTSYAIVATDRAQHLRSNNGSAVAWALPQAGSTGFSNNFVFAPHNIGAGLLTITPTTSLIGGVSSLALDLGEWCTVDSDNTNYFQRCSSGLITAGTGITLTRSASGVSIASSAAAAYSAYQKATATDAIVGGTGTAVDIYRQTIPAGTIAAGKCIEVFVGFQHTTTSTTTVYDWVLGSTALAYATTTNVGKSTSSVSICNNPGSTTAQQINAGQVIGLTTLVAGSNMGTAAENTANALDVAFRATVSTGTDKYTGYWFRVKYIP